MCGICGFFGNGTEISKETLDRMNSALVRRGPDESGSYFDSEVGLAMRRLSIIDLHGGSQPIHNEDRTVWIVLNGEIYNYQELRISLQARGHCFYTNSDTEVIVHLYEEYGEKCIDHLSGMFAFALWDTIRQRGLIARDRLGIKPLFYAENRGTIIFASEIKAILTSGLVSRSIDYQALDAFMTFTYIPAPLTIYQQVRKLEPGHLLIWESGRVQDREYWKLDVANPDRTTKEAEWLERFEHAIEVAVHSHMVSDVRVGAFLSGGIDSSLVVALMSRYVNDPVLTFTMGFGAQNSLIDERPIAKEVAQRYGCSANDCTVLPDLRDIVGDIVEAFDEPFADDSVIPSYYLAQFAHQSVKVAMSGLGGDELFAGYARYSGVVASQYYSRSVPRVLHEAVINPIVQFLPEPSHGGDRIDHAKRFCAAALYSPAERYLDFVSTLAPEERRRLYSSAVNSEIDCHVTSRIITEPFANCRGVDDVTKAMYVDLKTYLPEDILALSDRLSMWHSLEVRVPLIDHRLVELSAQLPSHYKIDWHRKKLLLRKIASSLLPKSAMEHRKQGFESPMATWLRMDLAKYARDVLAKDRLGKSGLFNSDYVSMKLEEHLAGRHKNNKLLFSLIMFQEWYERHVV